MSAPTTKALSISSTPRLYDASARPFVSPWQEWQGPAFVRVRPTVRSPGRTLCPYSLSAPTRTAPNARPESTSWGSLVRAQYRPHRKPPLIRGFSSFRGVLTRVLRLGQCHSSATSEPSSFPHRPVIAQKKTPPKRGPLSTSGPAAGPEVSFSMPCQSFVETHLGTCFLRQTS